MIQFFEKTASIDDLSFRQILLHPLVKNRKIVSVSIVGAFRKGKSFLLDYMLRYLYFTVSQNSYFPHLKPAFLDRKFYLKEHIATFCWNPLDYGQPPDIKKIQFRKKSVERFLRPIEIDFMDSRVDRSVESECLWSGIEKLGLLMEL